jgi:hypothetical protein
MSEHTIEQMNEAIARFMGMDRVQDKDDPGFEWEWVPSPAHSTWCFYHPPPFDRSWDWLMEVWKKAGKILYSIRRQLDGDKYQEAYRFTKSYLDACQKVEIEKAHEAVYYAIQLIQWYNIQKEANNE